MPLLISKSLLHSGRNRLLAPREANQIKQSGKEDSLFINLTRSPGDLHSRPEILLQLSLDASPTLLELLPWITQAGTCQYAFGRKRHRCYRLLHSTAFQCCLNPPLPRPEQPSPLPSPCLCLIQTAELPPSPLAPPSEDSGTMHGFTLARAGPAPGQVKRPCGPGSLQPAEGCLWLLRSAKRFPGWDL